MNKGEDGKVYLVLPLQAMNDGGFSFPAFRQPGQESLVQCIYILIFQSLKYKSGLAFVLQRQLVLCWDFG
jgi:hypothetical protein